MELEAVTFPKSLYTQMMKIACEIRFLGFLHTQMIMIKIAGESRFLGFLADFLKIMQIRTIPKSTFYPDEHYLPFEPQYPRELVFEEI